MMQRAAFKRVKVEVKDENDGEISSLGSALDLRSEFGSVTLPQVKVEPPGVESSARHSIQGMDRSAVQLQLLASFAVPPAAEPKEAKSTSELVTFPCQLCAKDPPAFGTKRLLFRHISACHSVRRLYACMVERCAFVAKAQKLVSQHTVSAHLACSICFRRCESEPARKDHYAECCAVWRRNICPVCGKLVAKVKQHVRAMHCEQVPKRKPENQAASGSGGKEELFACTLCPVGNVVSFASKQQLRGHIASRHGGLRPYLCVESDCNYVGKEMRHLSNHVARVHSASRQPKACPKCGKVLLNMAKHLRLVHQKPSESDRNFCPICRKSFSNATILNFHLVKHYESADLAAVEDQGGGPSTSPPHEIQGKPSFRVRPKKSVKKDGSGDNDIMM